MSSRSIRRIPGAGTAALFAALFVVPGAASAQGGDGFLFREPRVSLKLETGYGFQFASSEIFDDSFEDFTLSRGDLAAPYLGGEIAARVTPRVDVALSVGYSGSTTPTEYELYEDFDGFPIEQETRLRIVPVVVTAKYYFNDRGRTVGRFAWVPRPFSPYVGAGLGVVSYRFTQSGDFIDFTDPDWPVFFDDYTDSGTAAAFRGVAGVSISLGPQFELTGEARYQYANAEMGPEFRGYDPLDLSGMQGIIGFAVRF